MLIGIFWTGFTLSGLSFCFGRATTPSGGIYFGHCLTRKEASSGTGPTRDCTRQVRGSDYIYTYTYTHIWLYLDAEVFGPPFSGIVLGTVFVGCRSSSLGIALPALLSNMYIYT